MLIAADVSNPQSYTDVVELLVPELQKRGIFWEDYAVPGGTMRENFYARPGQWQLPNDHPSAHFRWNAAKPEVDALEGLKWLSPKVESIEERVSNDPLEGIRWRNPAIRG